MILLLTFKPLRASFSPQHSWDSPSRAFLLQGDLEWFPILSLPLLRFPAKPSRPCTVASAAFPHLDSRPPISLPRCLVQVGGFLLSWVFQPLRLLPPLTLHQSHLHFDAPFSLLPVTHFTMNDAWSLKVSLSEAWLSPFTGAGLFGLSHQSPTLPLRNLIQGLDYFFISGT